MYLHEISIEIRSKAKKKVVFNEFTFLTSAYRQSGQAINQSENVYWDGDRLFCHLKTIEKDALAARYNNIYVNNNISKLEGLCKSTLQFRIAGNDKENAVCKCKSPESYVLFTHLFNDASPIECGKCAKLVPLYRLPYYDDNSYYSILSWEYNYKACDQLQLGCTVGEKWALNQMQKIDSQLTKKGRAICNRLEELTKLPVYYYLFDYRKVKPGQAASNCPGCGMEWLLANEMHKIYDYKCDSCRLLSSISQNQ